MGLPMATDPAASVSALPVRLQPGDDLRLALQAVVAMRGCTAAFVLAGIRSLREAHLRLAGAA
jgi:predicted DNA-binding protein with PD1-like motif